MPRRSASRTRRRETADTWTLELEPVAAPARRVRARPVRDALRLRRRRGADLGQRRSGRRRGSCTPSAPSAPVTRGASARPSPATCSACAARSARWPVAGGGGRDVVVVAGGIGLAPLRPVDPRAAGRPRALRPRRAALRRPHARRAALPPTSSTRWAARGSTSRVTVDAPAAAGTGSVGVVTEAARARARSTPRGTVALRLRPRGDDALRRRGAAATAACRPSAICVSLERNMKCGDRPLRPLPARPAASSAGTAPCTATTRVEPLLAVREL